MVVFVVTAVPTAAAAAAVKVAVATTTAATAFVPTAAAAVVAMTAMDSWLLPDLRVCAAPHAHKELKAYWGSPERSFQNELTYHN